MIACAASLGVAGCSKKETAAPPADRNPVTAEQPTPPTTAADPGKPSAPDAKPTEPKPTDPKPTEPKPTEAKPTEAEPTEAEPTEVAPTEAKPTVNPRDLKPLKRPDAKPPARICTRACNKAQQCGSASGSVSMCVEACLNSLAAKAANPLAEQGLAFRAQERCADLACSQYETCVGKALLGEKALAASPPLAKVDATPRCERLCVKEQECHPQRFEQRPGGMPTCVGSCEQVLINPTDAMAPHRAMMNKTFTCIDEPCEKFEQCVRDAVLKK